MCHILNKHCNMYLSIHISNQSRAHASTNAAFVGVWVSELVSEWPKCLYFVWLLLFHSVSLSGQKRADGVSHTASVNIVNDEYSVPFGLSTLDGWVDFFSLCSFFNGSIIHSMARKFQNSVNEPPTTFQWNSFHHHHHRHQYNYILFAWHFLCVGRCFLYKCCTQSA